MLKLFMLHLQRLSILATAQGQIDVLALPLDAEYRMRVSMAHASTEAELIKVDAEIRKLKRGSGLQAVGV